MCMVISGHMMQVLGCCSCRDRSDKIITHMRINCRFIVRINTNNVRNI